MLFRVIKSLLGIQDCVLVHYELCWISFTYTNIRIHTHIAGSPRPKHPCQNEELN